MNNYTVKSGDTLSGIYGNDWKNQSHYTGDPTKLQVGTQLPMPANSSPVNQPNASTSQGPAYIPPQPQMSVPPTQAHSSANVSPNFIPTPMPTPKIVQQPVPQKESWASQQVSNIGNTIVPRAYAAEKDSVSSPGYVHGTPEWVKPIIQKAAEKYNIPTTLLSALLKQESGFNPDAKSGVGAQGIAQFMPACLTTDTEILTLDGWKHWKDVEIGAKIISYNVEKDLMEEDKIKEIKHYKKVKVMRMSNKRFDFISTLNHRWFVKHFKSNKILIKLTEELNKNIRHKLIRVAMFSFPKKSKYEDELVELTGWIFSDGSISKHSKSGQVDIYQSHKSNNKKCKQIDKLVVALGGKSGKKRSDGMMRWCITGKLAKKIIDILGYEKRITSKFLKSITQTQAQSLFESCMQGDGYTNQHANGNSYSHFIQGHIGRAEDFQLLSLFLGRIANIQTYIRKNKFQTFPDGKTYEVGMKIHANIRNNQNTSTDKRRMNYKVLEELMDVWCPVTYNQTWIAKRNGMVTITGNTAKGMGVDVTDPESSIMGAAQYLRKSWDKFGKPELALAAYNSGGAAVNQYGGIPPYKETQNYVKNIMAMAGEIHDSANGPYLKTMEDMKKQSEKGGKSNKESSTIYGSLKNPYPNLVAPIPQDQYVQPAATPKDLAIEKIRKLKPNISLTDSQIGALYDKYGERLLSEIK